MIRQSPTLRRPGNINIAAAHCRRALLRSQSTTMSRAGNVIMRAFNAVELDATPAATTRPHIGVRITA